MPSAAVRRWSSLACSLFLPPISWRTLLHRASKEVSKFPNTKMFSWTTRGLLWPFIRFMIRPISSYVACRNPAICVIPDKRTGYCLLSLLSIWYQRVWVICRLLWSLRPSRRQIMGSTCRVSWWAEQVAGSSGGYKQSKLLQGDPPRRISDSICWPPGSPGACAIYLTFCGFGIAVCHR